VRSEIDVSPGKAKYACREIQNYQAWRNVYFVRTRILTSEASTVQIVAGAQCLRVQYCGVQLAVYLVLLHFSIVLQELVNFII
jgi:hypothetical protein